MSRYQRFAIITSAVAAAMLLVVGGAGVLAHEEGDESVRVVVVDEDDGRAYLGVRLSEETEHPEGGARIDDVVEDSPAERAGLLEGDIVVGFDGKKIRGPVSLTQRIHASKPGDEVEVEVVRDGDRRRLTVELEERPDRWSLFGEDAEPFAFHLDQEKQHEHQERMKELQERLKDLKVTVPKLHNQYLVWSHSRPKLGVQLVEATPELREHLGGSEDAGVLVGKVLSGLPAEKAGIRVGDLIVSVDGDAIEDSGDLIEAVRDKDGETVTIELVRDRESMSLDVHIPEPEDEDDITGPRAWRVDPEIDEAVRESVEAALAAAAVSREEALFARAEAREMAAQARATARAAREEARAMARQAAAEARRAARELSPVY